MLKVFFLGTLVILAMLFIYPKDLLTLGLTTITNGVISSQRSSTYISFGNVKIDDYEKIENFKNPKSAYANYRAIYFNYKQAEKIEEQIKEDNIWSNTPFKYSVINQYTNSRINDNCYYYLVEVDKDCHVIETDIDILDNKSFRWYDSAIYDSENKILYYYVVHYKK